MFVMGAENGLPLFSPFHSFFGCHQERILFLSLTCVIFEFWMSFLILFFALCIVRLLSIFFYCLLVMCFSIMGNKLHQYRHGGPGQPCNRRGGNISVPFSLMNVLLGLHLCRWSVARGEGSLVKFCWTLERELLLQKCHWIPSRIFFPLVIVPSSSYPWLIP